MKSMNAVGGRLLGVSRRFDGGGVWLVEGIPSARGSSDPAEVRSVPASVAWSGRETGSRVGECVQLKREGLPMKSMNAVGGRVLGKSGRFDVEGVQPVEGTSSACDGEVGTVDDLRYGLASSKRNALQGRPSNRVAISAMRLVAGGHGVPTSAAWSTANSAYREMGGPEAPECKQGT
jgi:hypothetical protein